MQVVERHRRAVPLFPGRLSHTGRFRVGPRLRDLACKSEFPSARNRKHLSQLNLIHAEGNLKPEAGEFPVHCCYLDPGIGEALGARDAGRRRQGRCPHGTNGGAGTVHRAIEGADSQGVRYARRPRGYGLTGHRRRHRCRPRGARSAGAGASATLRCAGVARCSATGATTLRCWLVFFVVAAGVDDQRQAQSEP